MYGVTRYIELIEKLQQNRFVFSTDWSVDSNSRSLLLRHDIDFSVEHAHHIGTVESKLGIASTYFFMLTSNTYNLLSKRSRSLVCSLKDMGHKISLHFDPTVYDSLDAFLSERETFEKAFGVHADIVSIHRPGAFLEQNNLVLFGTRQTYEDQFFKSMKYISDSGGRDVFEPVGDFLLSGQTKALHLLIHPIWWTNEGACATETLDRWKSQHFEFITEETRANCKTYRG